MTNAEMRDKLAEWDGADMADALLAWLKEHLLLPIMLAEES